MAEFTEAQLKELETVFNLTRTESLPIKDGRVTKSQMVWWRNNGGPEHVAAGYHWGNIQKYPHLYSFARPSYTVQYTD